MKQLQKCTALLLAVLMVVSLVGCAGKGNGTLSEDQDKEKLYAVLDEILDSVNSGSKGGKLNSVKIAADIVSWAASSNMSKREAAEAVAAWVRDLPPEKKAEFKQQVRSVAEAYGELALDGANGLLEAAGVKNKVEALSEKLQEMVNAVLKAAENN